MSEQTASSEKATRASVQRRGIIIVPAILFAGLALLLASGLTKNPGVLPSRLIGRHVPTFKLPPVQGRRLGLSSADLGPVRFLW